MTSHDQRVAIARIVADHWRKAALADGVLEVPYRVMAHPLVLVIDALDGESDPNQLGVAQGEDFEAIMRITAS